MVGIGSKNTNLSFLVFPPIFHVIKAPFLHWFGAFCLSFVRFGYFINVRTIYSNKVVDRSNESINHTSIETQRGNERGERMLKWFVSKKGNPTNLVFVLLLVATIWALFRG